MIHWLIQAGHLRDGDNVQRLAYAVEELGMIAHVEPYVPFGAMDYSCLPAGEPVFVYGSVAMVQDALLRAKRRPIAFCDGDRLRCRAYFSEYEGALLQSPHRFVTLAELRRHREELFRHVGEAGALFVRPDENDKTFDGTVAFESDFEGFWAMANRWDPPDDMVCVVARPRRISQEWRVVIADARVVTGSQYRREGSLELVSGVPDEVRTFARGLAARWAPHPVFVMDIARTDDGLRLIEIGSVNCACFYESDVRAIARAVGEVLARDAVGSSP